ncbi:hypothetical protein V6N13_097511 [Hibiscus sabdariffa]
MTKFLMLLRSVWCRVQHRIHLHRLLLLQQMSPLIFGATGLVVEADILVAALYLEVASNDLQFAAGVNGTDGVENAHDNPHFVEFNEWLAGHDDSVESARSVPIITVLAKCSF